MNDADKPQTESLDEAVNADVAGVQGGDDIADGGDRPAQTATPGTVPDAPAPDGAEIEWAGGTVKKPPTPQG